MVSSRDFVTGQCELTPNRPRFLLSLDSKIRTAWDGLILVATVYIALFVPFEVTFMSSTVMDRPTFAADLAVETLIVLDILLNFRKTYKSEMGEVFDVCAIARHYLKTWFIIDLVAALPIDLLYESPIVHLLKTVRLLRLLGLMQKMKNISQSSGLVLTCLMSAFILLAHWAACLWYMIGLYDLNTEHWHIGWLAMMGEQQKTPYCENKTSGGPSEGSAYLGAIYFTLTSITTVGFGNISPNTNAEKVFSICLMMTGALMHALIFGNVSAIVYRIYAHHALYGTQMKELRRFIREQNVPEELKTRMLTHALLTWSPSSVHREEILQNFPNELNMDIHVFQFREILGLPLFKDCSREVLRCLSLHIRPTLCVSGERLVEQGEAVQAFYLLRSGMMKVLTGANQQLGVLERGSLMGSEMPHGQPFRAVMSVQAIGICELQGMSVAGLREMLQLYPDWAQVFYRDLEHHLTLDLHRGNLLGSVHRSADPASSPPLGTVVPSAHDHPRYRDDLHVCCPQIQITMEEDSEDSQDFY